MALRTEQEIRDKLADLRRRRDLAPNPKHAGVVILHARADTLEWVLGEGDQEDEASPL